MRRLLSIFLALIISISVFLGNSFAAVDNTHIHYDDCSSISTLDDKNYDLAMQAIRFRRYGSHIENLLDRTMDNKTQRKNHFDMER